MRRGHHRTAPSGNLIAVGAYLRTIRERRGFSRTLLAACVGTNESQLYKIERGAIDTRSSLMFALIATLGIRADALLEVYRERELTAAGAAARASAWLTLDEGGAAAEPPAPALLLP